MLLGYLFCVMRLVEDLCVRTTATHPGVQSEDTQIFEWEDRTTVRRWCLTQGDAMLLPSDMAVSVLIGHTLFRVPCMQLFPNS